MNHLKTNLLAVVSVVCLSISTLSIADQPCPQMGGPMGGGPMGGPAGHPMAGGPMGGPMSGPGGYPMGGGPMNWQAGREDLHTKLKLTDKQEAGWKTFIGSMQKANTRYRAMMQTNWAGLTAPERASKMVEMAKIHLQSAESRANALKTFYASLTSAQKKVFDEYHRGVGRMGHDYRRHMSPGQMPQSPMGGYGPADK